MNKTIIQKEGKPLAFHTFYGIEVPMSLKIGDYGTITSLSGNTTIVAQKEVTMVITQILSDIYMIKFFKDRKLVYEFIDSIYKDNCLIRQIGGVLVIMKDNRVIWNKVYPKR